MITHQNLKPMKFRAKRWISDGKLGEGYITQ